MPAPQLVVVAITVPPFTITSPQSPAPTLSTVPAPMPAPWFPPFASSRPALIVTVPLLMAA